MGTSPVGSNGLTTITGTSLVQLVADYQASQLATDAAISTAKSQATNGDTSTLNAAKTYTDGEVQADRGRLSAIESKNVQQDTAIGQTLTDAKAYADQRDQDFRTVDRALWRAEDDEHQTAAIAAAKTYTDSVTWDRGTAVDLNTLQTSGKWNAGSTTANRPVAVVGSVVVQWSTNTGTQVFTTREDVPREYFRSYLAGAWGAWNKGEDGSRLDAIEAKNTAQDTAIGQTLTDAKTYADTQDDQHEASAVAAANVNDTLAVAAGAGNTTVRNVIVNSAPHHASPAWFVSYGTSGAGTRTLVADATAPSGIAYLRHTWTTSATSTNAIIRTASSPATAGKLYAGSIWVRSSIDNVIGALGYYYDAGGAQLASKFNRLYKVKAGVWTRLDVDGLLAPAGTVAQRLGVGVNSAGTAYSAGDTLDVSAACMVEGSTVYGWFDGSHPAGYWAGEVGLSDAVLGLSTQPFAAPFTNAPQAAGARTGRYSTSHRLYLPEGASLEPIRRRIALALTGQGSYRLAGIGHSIVAGQGGTPGTIDNVRLLQQRAGQAGKAVTGMVTAVNNTTTDARVTFDAGWANIGTPRSNMQLHRRSLAAGNKFTYASDTAGTVAEIYTFGNGSAVTYSIDGAAPVTITPTGASAIQITTITGLSDAKHTVTVTSTTTAAAYLLGISVHYPTGLEVSNFGYSGSVAGDWRSDYFTASQRFYNGYNDAFTNWAADGAIIDLGANELIHGFTATDLRTNLGNIVSTATAAGKDIVLVLGTPVEDATRTTWFKDYYPVVYDIADLYRVPLIDLSAHWINRAVGAARGLYYDQWHPNNQGYFDLHGVWARNLLP